MKKHLKYFIRLVNFEFERMFKFLLGIMAILTLSNLLGFIYESLRYVNLAKEVMHSQSITATEFVASNTTFSLLDLTRHLWLLGPIALGVIGLFFYSVFIWYREWLGKNTFIYRLLMLPIPRMQIYFAKLLVVFLGIFSLLSLQFILLWIGTLIMPNLIPSELYTAVSVMEAISSEPLFTILFPSIFEAFLGVYGLGLVGILVLFTAILLERSFQIKGLVLGILYCIASLGLITFPFMLPAIARNYFILFNSETIILMSFFAVIVGLISLFVSRYLLKNKITI